MTCQQLLLLLQRVDLVDDQHDRHVQLAFIRSISCLLRRARRWGWAPPPARTASTSATLTPDHASPCSPPARFWALWKPGRVQQRQTGSSPRLTMPQMRLRVVWGLLVTMAIFSPTSALSRVALPTLGRPTMVMIPRLSTSRCYLDTVPVERVLIILWARPFRS